MFYSTTFLNRKGKFAVIWLAATKPRKLKRREVESVDIEKTCSDIMKYLPHARDINRPTKRPLLSLYLASQLMYGVVVIFDKQQKFFLNDLKQIIDKIKRPVLGSAIDMTNPVGHNIDMRDPLLEFGASFLETFGLAEYHTELSPAVMSFGDREYLEVLSAHSGQEEEPVQPRHIASRDEITLNENDWNLSAMRNGEMEFDFGEELPPSAPPAFVNIGDGTPPPLAASPLLVGSPAAQEVQPVMAEPAEAGEQAQLIDEEEPMVMTEPDMIMGQKPIEETAIGAPLMPQQPPPAPSRPISAVEPTITPAVAEPRKLTASRRQLPLEFELRPLERDEAPTSHRRGMAKRPRLFADRSTFISSDEMQRQIDDYERNNRIFGELVAKIPKYPTAEDLFEKPAIALGKNVLDVFGSNLISRHEPGGFDDIFRSPPWTLQHDELKYGIDRQQYQPPEIAEDIPVPAIIAETEAAAGRDMSSLEKERMHEGRDLTGERRTIDSVGRLEVEPGTETTSPTKLMPEIPPEQQAEQQPVMEEPVIEQQFYPDEQQQMVEEQRMEEMLPPDGEPLAKRPRVRSPPPVDHLAECYPAPPDMPNGISHTFALQRDQLEMTVYEMTSGEHSTTFGEICPLTATKAQAAKTFYMLLDLCRERKVVINQEENFGPITIKRA